MKFIPIIIGMVIVLLLIRAGLKFERYIIRQTQKRMAIRDKDKRR